MARQAAAGGKTVFRLVRMVSRGEPKHGISPGGNGLHEETDGFSR